MSNAKTPRSRLKVLHVIEDLENGGAERVLINLALGLDKQKFEVRVCCLTRKGRMAGELEEQGIPVYAMHKQPGLDLALVWRLQRLVRKLKIDIVHCHVFTANLWGRLAGVLARAPVIITHEHSSFTLDDARRLRIEHWLMNKTTQAISVSEELRQRLIAQGRLPASKITTIHNGLKFSTARDGQKCARLRREYGLEKFEFLVGAIGRLEYRKNYSLLLEAFAQVRLKFPQAGLLLVGAGPEEERLKQYAHALGLDESVVFAGYQTEVESWLRLMNIFCSSSQTEGISMAILEAMAAGVPVVATAVGGNPEIIPAREFGILTPANDAAALAQALIAMLRDPAAAQQVAQRAQERVLQHFSEARMLARVEELYLKWSEGVGE
jgi:glycosyltransferase involved in cell wall biosynthesis